MCCKAKSSQAQPQPLHYDDLVEPAQVGPPPYDSSFPKAAMKKNGEPVLITASFTPAVLDPDHKPNTAATMTENFMDCTTPSQSQPRAQPQTDHSVPFGDTSVPVRCPVCQQRTFTKTNPVSGGCNSL